MVTFFNFQNTKMELIDFLTPLEIWLAFLFFFSLKWYLNLKQMNNRASIKPTAVVPFFSLLRNIHRVLEWSTNVYTTLGVSTFRVKGPRFTRLEFVFTCDPRNVEYILKTNFANFPKGQGFKESFDILGNGIFNADYDSWRIQRKMAQSRLKSMEFKSFAATASREVVEVGLVPLLEHTAKRGSVIDLQDVFMRFAYDTSCITLFGKNPRYLSIGLPTNQHAKASDDASEAIYYRHLMPSAYWKLLRWLRVGKERKLAEAREFGDFHLAKSLSRKREELLAGAKSDDLLSSYLNFQGEEDLCKDDKFLRDTILTFYIAGRDTNSSALTWLFWLISSNPRAEEKILEELKLVVMEKMKAEGGSRAKRPYVFCYKDLRGLVYLHAAFLESLRLYPAIPIDRKVVMREDVLPDGTTVQPAMEILYSFYAMGRMKKFWGEDCGEFKLERWVGDDGKLVPEPMSKFFVFNIGPRSCLGKDLALTQTKLAAATIIFNFHVQVVAGQKVTPKSSIALHMKNGLMVRIKERG